MSIEPIVKSLKQIKSNLHKQRLQHLVRRFQKNGSKPWTTGYYQYKWSKITEVIDAEDFNSRIGTDRYGYRVDERIVELPWLFSRLNDKNSIFLDAGSALNFEPILKNHKIKAKKVYISTLAPEKTFFNNLGVSYIYEDIRNSCFRDNFFDEIACISTIEHVGLDNTFLYTEDQSKKETSPEGYLEFIQVLHSKLKAGGKMYLSFPYGINKNHGWFQVFNAEQVDSMIEAFNPSHFEEVIFSYKNDRWSVASRSEAADSVCYDINIQKEYAPDFCAFSRSVACLELVK